MKNCRTKKCLFKKSVNIPNLYQSYIDNENCYDCIFLKYEECKLVDIILFLKYLKEEN